MLDERTEAEHLAVLRELLASDRLRRASWDHALRDVAAMTQRALRAEVAMVATSEGGHDSWVARTAEGQLLDAHALSELGAIGVLEDARRGGEVAFATIRGSVAGPPTGAAATASRAVLAVPLRRWEQGASGLQSVFGGCLVAHRPAESTPFGPADAALLTDIAGLVEPTLNVLRQLTSLDEELRNERRANHALRATAAREYRLGRLTSFDPWFGERVLGTLRAVARSDRVGLLLVGPPGAGKSFLARAYHFECPRNRGPFVAFDCALPRSEARLAGELFGFAPGSALAQAPPAGRPGLAKLADGGTLYLAEVAALSSDLQASLMRLLRDRRVTPVGGARDEVVDVQVVAGSSEPLEPLVERGELREDLYWRLSEVAVEVPPLDQRVADIPALAGEFLHGAAQRFEKPQLEGFTDAARAALLSHPWSRQGNLRGLEQVVTGGVLLAPPAARRLDVGDLRLDGFRRELSPSSAPVRLAAGPRAPTSTVPVASSATPVHWRAVGRRRAGLRRVLEQTLREHDGDLDLVALDADLRAYSGHGNERVPQSTLYAWIRDLDLKPVVEAQRRARHQDLLGEVIAAIRRHGTASGAARALDMPRSALIWQLRRAGKTVADVLDSAVDEASERP